MPHDWSDDAERHSEREYEEIPDERESREIPDEIEKAAQEAAEEFDHQQEIERMADEAAKEFDEWESRQKEIEELAEAAAKEFDELQREQDGTTESLDDDLRKDLDEVRDELHEEYVDDMNRQLEGASRKDGEVEERSGESTSSEATETSESYEDAGSGMVHAMETKSETEEDMRKVSEPESQEPSEHEPESEDTEELLAEKHTNRIVRQEAEEGETKTHSDAQEVNEPTTSGASSEVSETEEDKEIPEVNKVHSESEPAVSRIEQREYEEPASSEEEGCEYSERSELEEKEEEHAGEDSLETIEPVETSTESEELAQDPEESPEFCDVQEPDPLPKEEREAEKWSVEHGNLEHETSESPEVETEVAQESVEEETLPEGPDDFVRRVKDFLNERTEFDDNYDYVQDPLTGEIQRVPMILGEYETDEQRRRRKNRNLFAELSEEERELFKSIVKERLEDEEKDFASEVERAWSSVIERAEDKSDNIKNNDGDESFPIKDYLERHPYLADSPRHKKLSQYLNVYLEFREVEISTLQELRDFADDHNITYQTAESWYSRKSQSELLNTIESHDEARSKFVRELSEKAKENLLDPSDIYHSFRPLKDVLKPSEKKLAESLANLCSHLDENHRMKWGRLYPYHAKGPLWLKDIGEKLLKRRVDVERALNERLKFDEDPHREIRVGVVGNNLYLRLKNTQPYVWSNLYREENFHLKTLEDKKNLIITSREALGLKGNIEFGRLAGQIADYSKSIHALNTNADLRYLHSHISGGTLDLINDALSQTFREIQNKIDYIGRGKRGYGVIRNPRLDTTPEKVIVPLISIIGSDGHIEPTYHIRYTEGRPERVERVKDAFNQLGDVDLTAEVDDKGNIILHAPAVVGRLLGRVDMKPGDKAIQNEPLADIARNASPKSIKDYARELIPEDGSFSVDSEGYGEFQWYRSVVLDAGVKTEKYSHTALISEEEKDFIKNHVEPQVMDFGSEEGREVYTMRIGRLKELMDDSDSEVSALAGKLCETIEKNPSKLLEDEREILKKIGISTNSYSTNIRVFTETGRISVSWQGQTSTNKDALTWAENALPNDETKREAVKNWLGKQTQE